MLHSFTMRYEIVGDRNEPLPFHSQASLFEGLTLSAADEGLTMLEMTSW